MHLDGAMPQPSFSMFMTDSNTPGSARAAILIFQDALTIN
jgi:hypothetical protein